MSRSVTDRSEAHGWSIAWAGVALVLLVVFTWLGAATPTQASEGELEEATASTTFPTQYPGPNYLAEVNDDDDDDDDDDEEEEEEEFEAPPPPANNFDIDSIPSEFREKYNDAFELFQSATKSGIERRRKDAISQFKKISRQVPGSALPHFYLSRLYEDGQDLKKARKSIKKAIKLKPTFYEAFEQLGDIEAKDGEYEKAIPQYEKALAIYEWKESCLQSLAEILTLVGRYDDAKKYLGQAIKIEKTSWRESFEKELDFVTNGPSGHTYKAETDHYSVVTDVSQEYADDLGVELETIRLAFDKFFPDPEEKGRLYKIYVFGSQSAYLAAGAPPNSLGAYYPFTKRIVLFKQPDHKGTLMTLKHEAFHQYCDQVASKSIPQWFNEGLADFFGSSEVIRKGGRNYARILPNKRRLDTIKTMIQRNACASTEELMKMSHREMYEPDRIFLNYCQAWSLIYFCIEGGKSGYQNALKNYFKAFTRGKSRDKSYELTFGKLDMEKFDRQWKNFTVALKEPE